ncbi:hypothetical protein GDO86_003593 [Hymenochirus boettgeri]|uniref:ADP-ribosylhydrolase ARH3 n=1 Tax=Hymenochirus boettgeri TaxID=247094 RepID=A0A8T2K717_9PIPI|nr:hypothetical protein GDO86_003593 [Hymenochirus boettgeri]
MSATVSRFRGALLGALLGDCLGSVFEGNTYVTLRWLNDFLKSLEKGERPNEALSYTDDTAMARSIVESVLENEVFDAEDLANRFTAEYKKDPDRGYGMGVVHVFEKLDSGEYKNVFNPAKEQFDGKGSYGNGAAMRVVGISLAYPSIQDIIQYAKTSGKLTHASSLGYNGAILQALAVHYALQGEINQETFLEKLLHHMEEVEADEKSLKEARELELDEFPYCNRLKKIKMFLEQENVPRKNVVNELGNGIAALESVPTAIYSFLRCLNPVTDFPSEFNNLQSTIAYCISLGGDTDTIATMAGAIAGAFHGEEQVPLSWKLCAEGHKEAESWGEQLYGLYHKRLQSTSS